MEVPRDALRAALPLLREIGDLKRVRTADSGTSPAGASMAERAFRRSWAELARGGDPHEVAVRAGAAAVAGARLAGVDGPVLRRCGLTADEAADVLGRSVAQHADSLGQSTYPLLRAALPGLAEDPHEDLYGVPHEDLHEAPHGDPYGASYGSGGEDPAPRFAAALCAQPRAGATCPGRPRLMVEPPESHGDHCWAVAVYGVLLAEAFGAEPGDVFLLGLGHHLHNAVLPDAGFSGEELLGEHLTGVVARLTVEQLAVLPGPLTARLGSLLALREAAEAPVARAFHAADVLDRVLQVRHHARAAAFTAEQALDDLDLVHPCAVSGFHRAVLDAAEAV
ncbi:HD domain-containing protein [Streptomyces apricus]|uniref:HD domain-containing protein n=1 Tax=Streptomyces apricus TaxID=1828112 RepID=A0A5B0BIH6_9ACTN|nr:HD domain-containing protein [Streptomyces apricus]